jgi:hypothetical protein
MPNAIWLDVILNGTPFRFFVPALIVTAVYVFVKTRDNKIGYKN